MPVRSTAVPALLAAVGLLAAACSGADSEAGADGTSASDPVTTQLTSPPPTSSDTVASTAPPATGPTRYSATPREAVDLLVDAWKFANRDGALAVAEAEAVDNLFTQPAEGFSLYGCDSGEFDTSMCNYRNRSTNGYAQITAEKREPGWIVVSVYMSTDG